MKIEFNTKINMSIEEALAHGLDKEVVEKGEVHEMNGDQCRHWLERGMCSVVTEEEAAVKKAEEEASAAKKGGNKK